MRDGSGYCVAHQADRKRNTFADPSRGSRHERGYGSAWDKRRARILARDNGLCVACLALGRVQPARHVDHIVPKASGGTDDDINLQSLCVPCHRTKTAREGGQKSLPHRSTVPGSPPRVMGRKFLGGGIG